MQQRTATMVTAVLGLLGWLPAVFAHPGRGIVSTRDGTVYFSDAGRSVVWKCSPDGTLTAAAPGVHSHWLALDPSGTKVYADHLRYDTRTTRFAQGLVRISPSEKSDTVEDVIKPEQEPRGLASGAFVIEPGEQLVRVLESDPAKVVRGPLAPTPENHDRQLGVLEGASHVGGLAARVDGGFLMTVKDEVRSMDGTGAVRVVASAGAIARDAPRDEKTREALYGDRLWGLCVLKDGAALVCDPSQRRVLRVGADGAVSIWHTATAPWSPVGVAAKGEQVVILEAGFEPPARNLGPRVVLKEPDGSARTLAEVDEKEPSQPYR